MGFSSKKLHNVTRSNLVILEELFEPLLSLLTKHVLPLWAPSSSTHIQNDSKTLENFTFKLLANTNIVTGTSFVSKKRSLAYLWINLIESGERDEMSRVFFKFKMFIFTYHLYFSIKFAQFVCLMYFCTLSHGINGCS